jgi:hypothetical protein
MIWVALAALGVPLWLCAVAIFTLVFRNRTLRKRPGNVPVRLRLEPGKRWRRGHALWVHDVFAFRGSPAAWRESLLWVGEAGTSGDADAPKHLGDHPVVVRLTSDDGVVDVAAREEHRDLLLGPWWNAAPSSRSSGSDDAAGASVADAARGIRRVEE